MATPIFFSGLSTSQRNHANSQRHHSSSLRSCGFHSRSSVRTTNHRDTCHFTTLSTFKEHTNLKVDKHIDPFNGITWTYLIMTAVSHDRLEENEKETHRLTSAYIENDRNHIEADLESPQTSLLKDKVFLFSMYSTRIRAIFPHGKSWSVLLPI